MYKPYIMVKGFSKSGEIAFGKCMIISSNNMIQKDPN